MAYDDGNPQSTTALASPPAPPVAAAPAPAPAAPAAPTINIDPNADPHTRLMQAMSQGGVAVVSDEDNSPFPQGYVHSSQVDQFLKDNPHYSRATVVTGPDSNPYLVSTQKVGQFVKDNPDYQVGLSSQAPPPLTTTQKLSRYLSVPALQSVQNLLVKPRQALQQAGAAAGRAGMEGAAASVLEPPVRQTGGFASLPNPKLGASLITPEEQQQQVQQARQDYPATMGVAGGAGEMAGGMAADPAMWPLMFSGGALPVVQKLTSAGFSAQMLADAYKNYPQIKEAADKGDVYETSRLLTQFGGELAGGVHGAAGAVGSTLADVTAPARQSAAESLRESAAGDIERTLGATTKENKEIASQVAPELAQRGVTAMTRKGLESQASAKMEEAGQKVDDYYSNLEPGESIPTQPILDHFEENKNAFKSSDGKVLDQDAINRIDDLKKVVQQFGPNVGVDDIVKLRQIWDKQVAAGKGFFGKTVAEGSALAAKKQAANSIRTELAKQYPDLDQINKEYSFWANVQKVIGDTVQRTASQASTPLGEKVLTGGAMAVGGPKAGLAMSLLQKALHSTAWGTTSAKIKSQMADMIAGGDVQGAANLASRATQTKIPFPQGPLFDVSQTPAPQRTGPFEMPASPVTPQQQPLLPPGAAAPAALPAGPPAAGPPAQIGTGGPGVSTPMLGPARLPQRILNPVPGFEAPMAPSPSAEQAAVQGATAQGRGPWTEPWRLGMTPGPAGYPEAKVTKTPTPAENVAPAAPESPRTSSKTRVNASGESDASLEGINRQNAEKSAGIKRYKFDARISPRRETEIGGMADVKAGPHEVIVRRYPNDFEEVVDQGEKVVRIPPRAKPTSKK